MWIHLFWIQLITHAIVFYLLFWTKLTAPVIALLHSDIIINKTLVTVWLLFFIIKLKIVVLVQPPLYLIIVSRLVHALVSFPSNIITQLLHVNARLLSFITRLTTLVNAYLHFSTTKRQTHALVLLPSDTIILQLLVSAYFPSSTTLLNPHVNAKLHTLLTRQLSQIHAHVIPHTSTTLNCKKQHRLQ